MKKLPALITPFGANAALAHDSTVPHLHPHAWSMLPDYGAMLLAALLVVAGVVALRFWRKG